MDITDTTLRLLERRGYLGALKGKRVLDVGCFTGTSTKYLREVWGADAYGLDEDDRTDGILGEHFIHSPMQKLPREYWETFDVVIEGNTLLYSDIRGGTYQDFIAMEAAALKPDGKLISLFEPRIDCRSLNTTPFEILQTYREHFKDVQFVYAGDERTHFNYSEPCIDASTPAADLPSFCLIIAKGPIKERHHQSSIEPSSPSATKTR